MLAKISAADVIFNESRIPDHQQEKAFLIIAILSGQIMYRITVTLFGDNTYALNHETSIV